MDKTSDSSVWVRVALLYLKAVILNLLGLMDCFVNFVAVRGPPLKIVPLALEALYAILNIYIKLSYMGIITCFMLAMPTMWLLSSD